MLRAQVVLVEIISREVELVKPSSIMPDAHAVKDSVRSCLTSFCPKTTPSKLDRSPPSSTGHEKK